MKKILLIVLVIIVLSASAFFIFHNRESKFYLEDKYYEGNEFVEINGDELNNIYSNSFVLFTYNNYCNFEIPCDQIFQSFMKKNNIKILSISFSEFKKTSYYETVKYAPSIIIVKDKKIVAYLDAEKDEDIEKYQDVNKFEQWIEKYIYFSKK